MQNKPFIKGILGSSSQKKIKIKIKIYIYIFRGIELLILEGLLGSLLLGLARSHQLGQNFDGSFCSIKEI